MAPLEFVLPSVTFGVNPLDFHLGVGPLCVRWWWRHLSDAPVFFCLDNSEQLYCINNIIQSSTDEELGSLYWKNGKQCYSITLSSFHEEMTIKTWTKRTVSRDSTEQNKAPQIIWVRKYSYQTDCENLLSRTRCSVNVKVGNTIATDPDRTSLESERTIRRLDCPDVDCGNGVWIIHRQLI